MYRILLPLLLGAGVAQGEFARWTSKDGKVAELELLKLETKDDSEIVTFRTRAGKTVTMNLTELGEGDRQRARDAIAATAAAAPGPEAGKLVLSFEGAAVHAKQPVEGGEPLPGKLEYRFIVRGATYAGIKPETLEVQSFKIGNRTVPGKTWSVTSPAGPNGSPLVLTSPGNFDAAKLSGSKLSATVTAVYGTVMKTARADVKVPKDDSKPVIAKVGPTDVHIIRDVRQVSLGIAPKVPQQIISYRLEGSSNFSLDLVKVGDTVPVVVDYWEEVKEVPLKLEAVAP